MPEDKEQKRTFQWKLNTPEGVKELYHWQHEQGTSFNSKVFALMGSADMLNMHRLAMSWPHLVNAWREWHSAPSSDEFFEQYKIYDN